MEVAALRPAALAWAELRVLNRARYARLKERYGSLEEAWEHLDRELLQMLGLKEQTIDRLLSEAEGISTEHLAADLHSRGIEFLTIEDPLYPKQLRESSDPPIFLFARGNLMSLQGPSLAIVGTRTMSLYGQQVVSLLIPDLVQAGLTTVSGLARGIDATVAQETLRQGGQTIAVLGHGFGTLYPHSHTSLAKEILSSEGLLLTEYPFSVRPDRYTFPARNRIIASLTLGTIVVEASLESGSLITAAIALEEGREVFAVPGSVFVSNQAGVHRLIARGSAKLITSAADVLEELGFPAPRVEAVAYRAQTEEEQCLLTLLTAEPQSIDDLVERAALPTSTVNATLTLMELKGGAKNVGMGRWVRGILVLCGRSLGGAKEG
jgi:DNA processing protein